MWTPPEYETLARGAGDKVLEPSEATAHKQCRPEAKSPQAYLGGQPTAPNGKPSLRKLGQEGAGRRSARPPPPGAQTSHPLPDPKCFRKTKPVRGRKGEGTATLRWRFISRVLQQVTPDETPPAASPPSLLSPQGLTDHQERVGWGRGPG